MRSVVWLVLLFTAAVVAATALGRNDALVTFYYGDWRLDMSLNLFLLGLLASVLALFAALQALNALIGLPTRAREWRELKRERAAQATLRAALAEYFAARFARAQKAAQRAIEQQADVPQLQADTEFAMLAELIAGASLHRLQDRNGRDQRLDAALGLAARAKSPSAALDGARLLAAEWALDDRDVQRANAALADLPPGVARRTQAMRLKLQATRLMRRPMEALQTARLLAKHQGFSALAAQSLLRSLASEALEQAYDEEQLRGAWQSLDAADRRDPWVAARAARHARSLGQAALGRSWLQPLWDDMARMEPDARQQIALALADCVEGLGVDWLQRVESALAAHPEEPAVLAAAGTALAERQLWGKARRPLEQAAAAAPLPARARRGALRLLARMARQEGDEARAATYEQAAATLD
jgi:HemY protein